MTTHVRQQLLKQLRDCTKGPAMKKPPVIVPVERPARLSRMAWVLLLVACMAFSSLGCLGGVLVSDMMMNSGDFKSTLIGNFSFDTMANHQRTTDLGSTDCETYAPLEPTLSAIPASECTPRHQARTLTRDSTPMPHSASRCESSRDKTVVLVYHPSSRPRSRTSSRCGS